MTSFSKWMYRISLVTLIVLLIDINSYWWRARNTTGHPVLTTNLILSGLIVVLLISKKLIRRH